MVKMRAKCFDLDAERPIVVLHEETARELDVGALDRIEVRSEYEDITAIVNVTQKMVGKDEVGLFRDVWELLKVREGDLVDIRLVPRPESSGYIRKKMDGAELSYKEIKAIIEDLMENRLSEVELTAWISAMYIRGLSPEETVALTRAIVESGEVLGLEKQGTIVDKHCIGGVAGNRTTMLIVPIIAASGLLIPKTSSRAITSPAGTADTMEVLAPVDLSVEEIREVVEKCNGCIAWGGATNLAAADDKLIAIRFPLRLDPRGVLIASILAKKKAVGAEKVLIDIPIGRGAKIEDVSQAKELAKQFSSIGRRLDMEIEAVITDGSHPIGRYIGPALEAYDVLSILMGKGSQDLREKALMLSGIILEMGGKAERGKGYEVAKHLLDSGKALKKMREIIEAQGGDPKLKLSDIPIGDKRFVVKAERDGKIVHIDNKAIAKIARAAGAPKSKGAGIVLYVEVGDRVKKGNALFEIVAESEAKLDAAIKRMEEHFPIEFEKFLIERLEFGRKVRVWEF